MYNFVTGLPENTFIAETTHKLLPGGGVRITAGWETRAGLTREVHSIYSDAPDLDPETVKRTWESIFLGINAGLLTVDWDDFVDTLGTET